MIAYRLLEAQQPPKLMEVEKPSAGSGQVLIKVGGCGLCHTDISLMKRSVKDWGGLHLPFTMGHEIAGWIEAIGPGVSGHKTGAPVAVLPIWGSCGHCAPCLRGEDNFCHYVTQMMGAGIGFDGGLAEYIAVESRFVVPMGDLDPFVAAPLTDAGLTTYTALKPALSSLVPGTTAVVIGIGGLGLMAVQLLRSLCSARVIAVDSDPKHLQLAKDHGADCVLPSDDTTAEQIRTITSGIGATFVLDCVGAEATLKTGAAALATLGRLTLVGGAMGAIPFSLHGLPWGAQFTTSLNGGTTNLAELLELVRLGRFNVVEKRYPLSCVEDAYGDLEHGKLDGRAVCVPGS